MEGRHSLVLFVVLLVETVELFVELLLELPLLLLVDTAVVVVEPVDFVTLEECVDTVVELVDVLLLLALWLVDVDRVDDREDEILELECEIEADVEAEVDVLVVSDGDEVLLEAEPVGLLVEVVQADEVEDWLLEVDVLDLLAELETVRCDAVADGFSLVEEPLLPECEAVPVHEVVLERVAVLRVVLDVQGVLVE